jgi:hypothetical protein
MTVLAIRASDAPRNTLIYDSLWAARSMVESWVLSPSSARKTREKVVIKVFHRSKIYNPLLRSLLFLAGNKPIILMPRKASRKVAVTNPIPAPKSMLNINPSPHPRANSKLRPNEAGIPKKLRVTPR